MGIEENEEARWVRVVHVYAELDDIPANLLEYIQFLDCVYPRIRIDCILAHGDFGPAMVQHIAERIGVPVNCMFINCPEYNFKHSLDRMGGVRVIMNSERASLLDGFGSLVGTPLRPSSEALNLALTQAQLES